MSKRVIVIGAGMAGIAAGKTLRDAGYEVTLFEARQRVGGRTHTDHSLGTAVDMGAAWIHGKDGNPLTPLAKKLGVETGHTDFLNRTISAVGAFDEDGSELNQKEYADGLQQGLGALYMAAGSELIERTGKARSFREFYEQYVMKPDNLSRSAELGFLYHSYISTEYVSASDADQLDYTLHGFVSLPGGDELVYGGGFNVITDHLAEGLDIRVGTPVSKVVVEEKGVVVEEPAGTHHADHVIITVPLGVLKNSSIQFEPPLPDDKAASINRIGFGKYEKIAMRFDRFYWSKEPHRFNYLSSGEPSLFHAWLNLGHYTGEPVIVCYHAGRRASHINKMSDGELVERAVEVMQTMFGAEYGDIPPPVAYARTGWESDPYSQGSYSFDKVGQHHSDRRTLAQPVGTRLFFAGEASHPTFYASVHGAYETGIRAAREVMEASNSL